MENQPLPTQQGQQPQQNQLNPKIVNLAKAIRHVESGGDFQAKGGSQEHGAYQFTPDTWAGAAPKFLGRNIPLKDASPQEQNEVAYKQLDEWDKEHPEWNVGNFASAWNAGPGKPNAYAEGHKGVNKFGIAYDTPAYAKQVAETYQSIKATGGGASGTGKPSTTPNTDSSLFSKAAPYALGGTAALGAGVLAAPEIGAGALLGEIGAAGEEGLGFVKNAIGKIGGLLGLGGSEEAGLSEAANAANAASSLFGSTSGDEEGSLQEQITKLEQSMPEAQSNQRKISSAVQTMLGNTTMGNKFLMTPEGSEATQTLGMYGAVPHAGPNGTADSTKALELMKGHDSQLARGIENTLNAEGATGSTHDVLQHAYDEAARYNPKMTEAQLDTVRGHIAKNVEREQASADKEGRLGLGKMNQHRKSHGAASRFDLQTTTEQRAAHKALNSAYRNEIMKNSQHKELVTATLAEEKKIHKGIKALEIMHGKKMPVEKEGLTHTLLKEAIKFAGARVGDKIGGPVGAVLGYLTTQKLTNAVDKRLGKQLFETPGIEHYMEEMAKKSPAAYHVLVTKLEEHGVNVPARLERLEKKYEEYKKGKEQPSDRSEYEPYTPHDQLPVIAMGNKPKRKDTDGLPVVSDEDLPVVASPEKKKIDMKKVKGLIRKKRMAEAKHNFLNEPYQDETTLPVIKMGNKPRSKTSGLPVIRA